MSQEEEFALQLIRSGELSPTFCGTLADELVADCNRLMQLGIVLDKAGFGAKAAGAGAGVAAGLSGHWLIGLVAVVGGFLLDGIAEGWKKIKFNEVRAKWFKRLSSMNNAQKVEFGDALGERHPMMLVQARTLLQLSSSMN